MIVQQQTTSEALVELWYRLIYGRNASIHIFLELQTLFRLYPIKNLSLQIIVSHRFVAKWGRNDANLDSTWLGFSKSSC